MTSIFREQQQPHTSPDTVVVAAGRPPRDRDAPVNPPLVLSSTYFGRGDRWCTATAPTGGTPTPPGTRSKRPWPSWRAPGCPAWSSPRAWPPSRSALSLVPPGGVLVMPQHSYQGSLAMAEQLAARGVLELRTVDIADTDAVTAQLRRAPHMLWLESPTNPMLGIAEMRGPGRRRTPGRRTGGRGQYLFHAVGAAPLAPGVDVVVHSVTKYLAGHSDVVLGAVVTSDGSCAPRCCVHRITPRRRSPDRSRPGWRCAGCGPWRCGSSARRPPPASWRETAAAPGGGGVRYPGLPEDPGHARADAQMDGFGSIIAIQVKGGAAAADKVIDALQLWLPATSLGGVESLIERRRRHVNEPDSVPENLLRLSVGIENPEDLWADLEQALTAADG